MRNLFFTTRTLVLCLVALSTQTPVLAFVTVGNTADCDFDNLFTAYNDSDPEVRVTSEQVHTNNFTIEKIKIFKGGYDTCLDAEQDQIGATKTRWSGLNALNNTVVNIDANLAILSTVIFERFEFHDGNNTSVAEAGGIKVSGNSNLVLIDSIVRDNRGNEGGGIHVTGAQARLTLQNTLVQDNEATGYGGGIYCTNDARVIMDDRSSLYNNTATLHGGGLFADSLCLIDSASGIRVDNGPAEGISGNVAQKGGGLYLQAGAVINLTGSYLHPARVILNLANGETGLSGGGMFLTGAGTQAHLINAHISNNDAFAHGGGLVVTDQAQLTMQQHELGCDFSDNDACSAIEDNRVSDLNDYAAAGYFSNGAQVDIAQTVIAYNRSHEVSAFALINDVYLRLEGNLFNNNDTFINGSSSETLFLLQGGLNQASQLDFGFNTVTNNDVDNFFTAQSLNSSQIINVFNSIVWDFGTVFNFNGPTLSQIDCSVAHETGSLSGNVGAVLSSDPLFINAAMADFRPSLASDVIDFCNNNLFTDQHRDLNNFPRGHDMINVNNAFGTYDAGAYEYFPDIIFRTDFD